MSERRVAVLIFTSLLLAYLYTFPHWLDWNQNSRFDLTASLVERGTFAIDDYMSNTGDYSEYNGHAYSDKTPGLSFLAVPIYAVTHRITQIDAIRHIITQLGRSSAAAQTINRPVNQIPDHEFVFTANLIFATWLLVTLPSALLGVLLFIFLGRLGYSARGRAVAVLVYALATPAFSYSAAFYSHQLTAVMLFAAFAWIYALRQRQPRSIESLLLGGLLGFTIITEVPTVPIVALLGLYAIWTVRRLYPLALMAVGGAVPLAIMGLYHWSIFGTPLTLAYLYHTSPLWREHFGTGLLSVDAFRFAALYGMTFSPYRGLFIGSPILIVAVLGFVLIARRSDRRAEWFVSLGVALGLLLVYSASSEWFGGYAAGPRYLVPVLPFVVWPIAAVFDRVEGAPHRWRCGIWVLMSVVIIVSILLTWVWTVDGQYYTPDDISNPLIDYGWPRIIAGDVARNWGMIFGLPGAWSLLPLIVLLALTFGLTWLLTAETGERTLARRY